MAAGWHDPWNSGALSPERRHLSAERITATVAGHEHHLRKIGIDRLLTGRYFHKGLSLCRKARWASSRCGISNCEEKVDEKLLCSSDSTGFAEFASFGPRKISNRALGFFCDFRDRRNRLSLRCLSNGCAKRGTFPVHSLHSSIQRKSQHEFRWRLQSHKGGNWLYLDEAGDTTHRSAATPSSPTSAISPHFLAGERGERCRKILFLPNEYFSLLGS
jgi:hypothetical protein